MKLERTSLEIAHDVPPIGRQGLGLRPIPNFHGNGDLSLGRIAVVAINGFENSSPRVGRRVMDAEMRLESPSNTFNPIPFFAMVFAAAAIVMGPPLKVWEVWR
jgi:hypothetical protein